MKINDKWQITYDGFSYILRETVISTSKKTKETKETQKSHGYFANIGLALRKYIELNVGEHETVQDWIDRYEKLTNQVLEIGE